MTELSKIQLAMCKVIKEHGWPKVGAYPDRAVKRAINAAYDYNWPPLSVAVISANGETLTKEHYEKWSNGMSLPDYDFKEIYREMENDRKMWGVSFSQFMKGVADRIERDGAAFPRRLEALKLKYQDKMTYKHIGESLGVSPGRAREIALKGARCIRDACARIYKSENCKNATPDMASYKIKRETNAFDVVTNTRVRNVLKALGVKTCGDIIGLGREKLMSQPEFGKKSLLHLEWDFKNFFGLDDAFKIN